MSKRLVKKPLHKVKGFIVSSLVCSVALFPLFGFFQLSGFFIKSDSRKLISLPEFQKRAIDSTEPVKLFKEPLISITFDDGRESVYYNATPLLLIYGIRSTQYLLSGTMNDQSYLNDAQIKDLQKANQEIACHTVSHRDLTTLNTNDLDYELVNCQKTLNKFAPVHDFASPYGHVNQQVTTAIKKYYRSSRNTNGDIINGISDKDINTVSNFNRYDLISSAIRRDTTVEQLQAAVDYTIKNNGWLILTYHQIEDNDNATFGLDPKSLEEQLEFLSTTSVRIVPIGKVTQTLKQTQISSENK